VNAVAANIHQTAAAIIGNIANVVRVKVVIGEERLDGLELPISPPRARR